MTDLFYLDGSRFCVRCGASFWPLAQDEHCPHATKAEIRQEIQAETVITPSLRRDINRILEKENF